MQYEYILNMNGSTGKFATWCVRIFDPHVVSYQFTSRGEQVDAEKIVCYIVGEDPTQYAQGAVPFDFGKRNAAREEQCS